MIKPSKLLLALGSALLATACTITLDPSGGGDDGGNEECLELFETCVELAGDSPGCQAVFDFCSGADDGGDDGGPMPDPGCEDEYIDCLAEVGDADQCEPILEECYGGGDEGGCMDDDPDCQPCPDGNCEPTDDCQLLLDQCYEESMGDDAYCQQLYPECFDVDPPQPGDCEWYYGECNGQFTNQFCEEGGQACENGILPEYFDCGEWFPQACNDVTDQACAQAEDACWNGFEGVELCGSISNAPQNFVQELAQCNGWE